MKNNIASASGKLILMGEHAVLYGAPCIVTAVNKYLTVTIEKNQDNRIVIETPQTSDTRFLDASIKASQSKWGSAVNNFHLKTKSDFTDQYGLGSSAAVVVATLKAISEMVEVELSQRELFDMSYEVVLAVQNRGSGFDVAASVYGGVLYFQNAGKVIERLPLQKSLPLIVGYTGKKASTVSLMSDVSKKYEQYPEKVSRIMSAIGTLVEQAKPALIEGDWPLVGKFMNFNQEYLRDLGVSTEKLEALIQAALSAGAFGAKLSGAGGGDCMIAVTTPENRMNVERAISNAGGEVVRVTTDDQNELFIVVDRKDTILGYKTRYECHHNPLFIHRTVGALIFNDDGQLLLQKRSMTKDMEAGLWGISVAGHVTKGQSDDEAIHRELLEELGIDTPLTFLKKFFVEDEDETERAAVYKGVLNGPFVPNAEEVAEVRFVDLRDIGKYELTFSASKTLHEVGVVI
jgi:mevalonate kinase